MRKMFSENQIKNIVNQGIESGEVNASKLYVHHIEANNDILMIVSTSSTPIDVAVNAQWIMFDNHILAIYYFYDTSSKWYQAFEVRLPAFDGIEIDLFDGTTISPTTNFEDAIDEVTPL